MGFEPRRLHRHLVFTLREIGHGVNACRIGFGHRHGVCLLIRNPNRGVGNHRAALVSYSPGNGTVPHLRHGHPDGEGENENTTYSPDNSCHYNTLL